jgi:hypothetical protein
VPIRARRYQDSGSEGSSIFLLSGRDQDPRFVRLTGRGCAANECENRVYKAVARSTTHGR